jgi:glycosyltransferase involved in cell wall biosynthesis
MDGLDLQLDVVGRIPDEALESLKRFGICFTEKHYLSEQELCHAYEEADIIYFPTLFEGFGLPIIEGFQFGRPVLTSDLSPMKDIAEGAAMLVDPYKVSSIREGLLLLLNDHQLRASMVKKGIEIARKYDPVNIIKSYEMIWKKNFRSE